MVAGVRNQFRRQECPKIGSSNGWFNSPRNQPIGLITRSQTQAQSCALPVVSFLIAAVPTYVIPTNNRTEEGVAMSPNVASQITRTRIERALWFMAKVVAGPDGEVYLPIFERLERELATLDAKTDALARARSLLATTPRSSPSTPRGA